MIKVVSKILQVTQTALCVLPNYNNIFSCSRFPVVHVCQKL